MIELKLAEMVIFALYYSLVVLIVLIKHKKDKAPFTSYLLNPEMTKIPYFVYASVFGFLTGLSLFLGYIYNTVFLFGYIFALLAAIFIILDLRFWYSRFRRFL